MNINKIDARDLLYEIANGKHEYVATQILTKNGQRIFQDSKHNKSTLLDDLIKNYFKDRNTNLEHSIDINACYNYTKHTYVNQKSKGNQGDRIFIPQTEEETFQCLDDNLMHHCNSIATKLFKVGNHAIDVSVQEKQIESIKGFLYYKLTKTDIDLNNPISSFNFENPSNRKEGIERLNKFFNKILEGNLKSSEQKENIIDQKFFKYGERYKTLKGKERQLIEHLQNDNGFTNAEANREILEKLKKLLRHLKDKNLTNPNSENVKNHLMIALESIQTELNLIKPDWTKVNWNSFTNENIINILSNDYSQMWNELKNNFIDLSRYWEKLAKVQNKIQSLPARYVPQVTIEEIPAKSTSLPQNKPVVKQERIENKKVPEPIVKGNCSNNPTQFPNDNLQPTFTQSLGSGASQINRTPAIPQRIKIQNEILDNPQIKPKINDETTNRNNRKSFSVFNWIGNGLIAVKNGFIAFVKMLWPFGKKS